VVVLVAAALWSAGAVVVVVLVAAALWSAGAVVVVVVVAGGLAGAADALVLALLADASGAVEEAEPDGAEPAAAQWSEIILTSLT
jgi:hypothetical protein